MFFLHAGFMATGLLLVTAGFAVVRFMKGKPWRLKSHAKLQTAGGSFLLFGLAAAFLMVAQHNGPHFNSFHTLLGALTILFTAVTLTLGLLLFQWKALTLKLKVLHRWAGRVTFVVLWITAILGLRLAGIF